MTNEEAIKWMEEAIVDTKEFFDQCSPALQKELIEQKEVFELAISAIRAAPKHLDQEAWTAEWIKHDGYTECSKCEHWYDSPENEDEGDRPAFCPSCGRAMRPKAWSELEKRLRG